MDAIDIVLLLLLGSEYDAVVTSIELQLKEQLSRLLDEEIKQKGTLANRSTKNEAEAFAGGAPRKPPKKKSFKCFGCQKEGHKGNSARIEGSSTGQHSNKLYELSFYAAKGECGSLLSRVRSIKLQSCGIVATNTS